MSCQGVESKDDKKGTTTVGDSPFDSMSLRFSKM